VPSRVQIPTPQLKKHVICRLSNRRARADRSNLPAFHILDLFWGSLVKMERSLITDMPRDKYASGASNEPSIISTKAISKKQPPCLSAI
jgi:hypothetical protein